LLGIVLQRTRRGRARSAGSHRGGRLLTADKTMDRTAEATPTQQTTDRPRGRGSRTSSHAPILD
jgi:hypothetical protein